MKCSRCGSRAVVEIRYARANLCEKCFEKHFEKRVRRANLDFGLLRRGDKIAVAVSGGKDSAAMLSVLDRLAKEIGAIELLPVAVDEGIRGYRDETLRKARSLAEGCGYELTVFSFEDCYGASLDEMLSRRRKRCGGACSYCGVFRKRLLNKAASRLGANKIAVGHNLDDVCQTFLMNLLRSDEDGIARSGALSELKAGGGLVPRIKPLIYVPERECALFSELKGLPYRLGACPYSGEAFRGVVKNFLNEAEEKHPGTKLTLLNSFLEFKEKNSRLDKEKSLGRCVSCGSPSGGKECRACVYARELGLKPL